MIELFQPDLFSRTGPAWHAVTQDVSTQIHNLVESIADPQLRLTATPEQSGALDINSSNLRLTTEQGRYLLKHWSEAADSAVLQRTLELMEWLAQRGLPVPAPLRCDGAWLFEQGGSRWSLFPFVDGSWFTGAGAELEASAGISGALSAALAELPPALLPEAGPLHLTEADDEVLERMGRERRRWTQLVGAEHAAQLSASWDDLTTEWARLRAAPPEGGAMQAVHFDLHPHNLLMQDGRVTAVLDFEACKVMPVGYAMAFAGLKQGRQAVIAQQASPAEVGATFLAHARAACPVLEGMTRFADLAAAEAMRRLALIIRLNIDLGIRTWNKVLPVQLAHVQESRILFGKQGRSTH